MKNYGIEYKWLNVKNAKIALEKLMDFLEKNKITAWLDWGTLLGAYREKKFIVYDFDVDLGFSYEDYKKLQDLKVRVAGNKTGIIFGSYTLNPYMPSVMCASYLNIKLDLYIWFKKGDKHNLAMNYNVDKAKYFVNQVPFHYHNKLDKMFFLGREYYVPFDIENYIHLLYGDTWKQKIKTGGHNPELIKYLKKEEIMEKEILEEK